MYKVYSSRAVTKLFSLFVKPRKPESTNSLARWMKSILSNAGIDTSVFKAHNVRGASVTNANKRGCSSSRDFAYCRLDE